VRTGFLITGLLLLLAALGASSAGARTSYCAGVLKDETAVGHRLVAVAHSNGATFYRDKSSRNEFFVCSERARSSSEGETVDGATGFTLKKFRAAVNGRCALAAVVQKGHPRYAGSPVAATIVGEFRLFPHQSAAYAISATPGELSPRIGKMAFSANCFSGWAETDGRGESLSYGIEVVNMGNLDQFNDPNYLPAGAHVSTTADLSHWSLKAHGKGATLSYTDDGVAKSLRVPFKAPSTRSQLSF
jgi:hypothetical protein